MYTHINSHIHGLAYTRTYMSTHSRMHCTYMHNKRAHTRTTCTQTNDYTLYICIH